MSGHQNSRYRTSFSAELEKDGSEYFLKVLLYSHDSVGLGHLRRNLAIAREITSTFLNSKVLILTGSSCDKRFKLPKNTDLINIPSISKNDEGGYVTRNFSGALQDTLEFRSKMILEAFQLFEPGLIIMDHQLTGLLGEALPMLQAAKQKGVQTIFGLRDIKDNPEVVRRTWSTESSRWALNECYDRVCVYGMQSVFDPLVEYAPFLDQVKQIDFTGYIVPGLKKPAQNLLSGKRKKVLVTFGGGGDGAQRAEKYLLSLTTGAAHWDSHIITGPLMAADTRRRIQNRAKKLQPLGSVRVYRFHRNIPALLQQVDAVVSMAGYNSCVEILQSSVPAVLLPRSFPRKEQLIRATRFAQLGWATVIPSTDPDPQELFSAVEFALSSPRKPRSGADLNGLSALCRIIVEQLQTVGVVENVPQSAQPLSRAL